MKSFFSQTSKFKPCFSASYTSFPIPTENIYDKKNIKTTKNIQNDIKALHKNGIGLQSILRTEGSHMIGRTRIEAEESRIPCSSDTKSTQSESRTYVSSATSNGATSRQSNADIVTPTSLNEEDMIQKYYFELRNSLKCCLSTKQPPVYFNDIAGNTYAKQIMQEAFVLPNLSPEYFSGNHKSWNKILLYGPPGVGKTMMARAVAKEVHATILWVSLADITSKYIGESEKLLRMLFELAREKSPSVIIMDEMDSIGRMRKGNESETERRIKTEFLRQMDEISNGNDNVYVLGTTNMPWELDIAALRRFDRKVYLPMPDIDAREQIFRSCIGDRPHELKEQDFKYLAEITKGYTGSDISNVVKDALMKPARMLQETSYFKKIIIIKQKIVENNNVTEANKDNEDDENIKEEEFYMPCYKDEEGSIKKELSEIPRERLLFRKVNLVDLKESVKNCRPTVCSSALSAYSKFLLKFGHLEQKGDLSKEDTGYEHFYL